MHKLTFNMINNKLLKEIEEYCLINNISDVNKEINRILKIGFNIVKYGNTPFGSFNVNEKPKEVNENIIQETEKPVIVNKNEEKIKKRIRIVKNE